MARGKAVDADLAKAVHRLYKIHKSYDKVSKMFGHSRQWSRSILKRYDAETGIPLATSARGRPRKTTADQDQSMVDFMKDMGTTSLKKGMAQLKEKGIVDGIHHATLARRIKETNKVKKAATKRAVKKPETAPETIQTKIVTKRKRKMNVVQMDQETQTVMPFLLDFQIAAIPDQSVMDPMMSVGSGTVPISVPDQLWDFSTVLTPLRLMPQTANFP